MSVCFNVRGGNGCLPTCGYNDEADFKPAIRVADQMKLRAEKTKPKFVLNVGDNFYWGGIPLGCGEVPLAGIHYVTGHMFDTIYNQIYNSRELLDLPWLSVLGNHDYGGWTYASAWDQQIAYTWHSPRWRLPAQYWHQHVDFSDKGFDMDIFLLDSNNEDALPPSVLPSKNLCSYAHNPKGATCGKAGGPQSPDDCPGYFGKLWQDQVEWVEKKLKESTATWQLIVTHFPCGHQAPWYEKLHAEFGLDLLVTGHTHVQSTSPLGGLLCVISGGGGGILSDAPSVGDLSNSYGFYDAMVNRTHLVLESINFKGNSLGTWVAYASSADRPARHEVVGQKPETQGEPQKHRNLPEAEEYPQAHQKDKPATQQNAKPAMQDEKPGSSQDDKPAVQDEKPAAKQDDKPATKQKETLAVKQDDISEAREEQPAKAPTGSPQLQATQETCGVWCQLLR